MTTISSPIATPLAVSECGFGCAACAYRGERPPVVLRASDVMPFELVECPACRLVQQSPRYSPAELARLYRRDYYVFEESDAHRWARAVQQYVIHLHGLERPGGPRLLEIGCATGQLGALAAARGWRYTGIDVSAEAVSRAAVRFGLDVRAGTLAQHAATLHPYDVIFLGDVIEHVLDPASLMAELRKVLTPGGVVCIDTPNWASRWRRVFGRCWLGLNRYHINLFDASSLRMLLARQGFLMDRCGSYTHCRYEAWPARPEVRRWLDRLPGFAAWRVGALLDELTSRRPWVLLRRDPPTGLEPAQRLVHVLAGQVSERQMAFQSGDNLFVTARRPA